MGIDKKVVFIADLIDTMDNVQRWELIVRCHKANNGNEIKSFLGITTYLLCFFPNCPN